MLVEIIEYLINVISDKQEADLGLRVKAAHILSEIAPEDDRFIMAFAKAHIRFVLADPIVIKPSLKVLPELINLLDDKDESFRRTAVYLIGNAGPDAKSAIEPLTKILMLGTDDDEFIYERAEVAEALGKICANTKESVWSLFLTSKYRNPILSSEAKKAFKRITPYAIESLIELFKERRGMGLFFAIKDAGPLALPYLLKALESEEDLVNKANFILLLGDLASEAEDTSMQSKVIEVSIKALGDKNKEVRYNAVTSLSLLGPRAKDAIDFFRNLKTGLAK